MAVHGERSSWATSARRSKAGGPARGSAGARCGKAPRSAGRQSIISRPTSPWNQQRDPEPERQRHHNPTRMVPMSGSRKRVDAIVEAVEKAGSTPGSFVHSAVSWAATNDLQLYGGGSTPELPR